MDERSGTAERPGERVRLLLLYSEPAQAASLVQRLPSTRYEVISCPVFAQTEGWVEELQPALVLLAPPDEPKPFLETCAAVRERTERPIVVLSERSEERLVTQALAAGADEYLVLPIGDRELVARIEAMVRRLRRSDGLTAARQVGDLLLSPADHAVVRKGRRIFLSPIEFRLLSCLASAPGRVLTHQTLMSRVWGVEYVDARHYLRVYVRYLREKLEDDPAHPRLIVSEWGVGYRLQAVEPATETKDRAAPTFVTAPSYGIV